MRCFLLARLALETIIQIPCLAHVIQLFLKQLLDISEQHQKSKEVGTSWSDSQFSLLRNSKDCGDVAHTFAKVSSPLC